MIGTVEELAATSRTQSLVREQFEMNFYGPVNCIKAILPSMRRRGGGHIVVLSSISTLFYFRPFCPSPSGTRYPYLTRWTANHLGTPGLGITCASGWALDGFCDSLAYEIAPFNIKISIVQPNMEVNVLTHKITSAPPMEQYSPERNPAPLCRGIIGGLLDRIEGRKEGEKPQRLAGQGIESLYPVLPNEMKELLLAETVHAILAIGGHENPPARHIVGYEGVDSVKEKLKTVSEELEDFVGVSCAVDIEVDGHGANGIDERIDGVV